MEIDSRETSNAAETLGKVADTWAKNKSSTFIQLPKNKSFDLQKALDQGKSNLASAHYRIAKDKFQEVVNAQAQNVSHWSMQAEANLHLGQMYHAGRGCIKQDLKLAEHHLKLSCNLGYAENIKNEAKSLLNEMGVNPADMQVDSDTFPDMPMIELLWDTESFAYNNPLSPAELLVQAERHLDAGQYEEAVKKYTEISHSNDPYTAAEAKYRLGERHSNGEGTKKSPIDAILLWKEAAAQNINKAAQAWSFAQLGDAYLNGNGVKQSDETAKEMFRQAEIVFPNSPELQALIKEIQQESARKKAAQIAVTLENCLKELQSTPRAAAHPKPYTATPALNAQAIFARGWQYYATQNFKMARQYFELVVTLTTDPLLKAKSYLNLGALYNVVQESKKAQDAWNEVLEIKANRFTVAYADLYLGMLYEFGGNGVDRNWEKALEHFQAVLKQNDNKDAVASALFAMGDMYYHSPNFYKEFETLYLCLFRAANQKDNPEVAVTAQVLLKEVITVAARQTLDLAVKQKALKYLNQLYPLSAPKQKEIYIPLKDPSLHGATNLMNAGRIPEALQEFNNVIQRGDPSVQKKALTSLNRLHPLSAPSQKNDYTPLKEPSLIGAKNLMHAGRIQEAFQEFDNIIKNGLECEKGDALSLKQSLISKSQQFLF